MSKDPSSSEVDALLRAAEDHLLLNLRLNSHSSKSPNPFASSSSPLDTDLASRFDVLKSPLKTNPNPNSSKALTSNQPKDKINTFPADEESTRALGDDLAARFAALKGSSSSSSGPPLAALPQDLGIDRDRSDDDDGGGGVGVSKKEVEKLMEWAKDAARLDPSKSDDDDDDSDLHHDDDDDDRDNSDDSVEEMRKKKEKSKGKPKPKRFFFF